MTDSADRSYLIADLPEAERPRERMLRTGATALTDSELIAIILKSGPRGRSTLDLARDVLHHFGNDLGRLAAASPVELTAVKGIGPAKACELRAAFELAARLTHFVRPERRRLVSPEAAADYLRGVFQGKRQEELHCLLLDNKNTVIHDQLVTVGLLDRSQSHAREVFREAIARSASRVILAHNHPSGDPTPSREDIAATRRLVAAGRIVGIHIVDHLVLGSRTASRGSDYYSFREHELLDGDAGAGFSQAAEAAS